MIKIGEFMPQGDSYSGRLTMLGIDAALTIVPAISSAAPNAPAYRIHAGEGADGREIGAGWTHSGERSGPYLALLIDDPQLPRAIRANLFRPAIDGGPHQLFWQRHQRRRDTGQAE
ncbi:DUF736 domain-containing protein [Sphingomonas sp. R647]|uniref:DUF736 domain-containing protein n=1 Tax=Sphingomonas sp. R647 TaxID=2875233 RepID=UPI001CD6491E|nr:DUF736 domain-containing protein [Sphingomonas sp. R647]MCA1200160.1 DUF736 domain-containing protein [Sphingomonas sp. R647]